LFIPFLSFLFVFLVSLLAYRVAEAQCLFPSKPGSATKPLPGFVFKCLDDNGDEMARGELGHLVVRLPLPPGCLPTLFRNDQKFVKAYLSHFPGYYETGDSGLIDEDGYVFVMTRTDDIINVNGVRISTGNFFSLKL
jgi:propionyl-CoA synthetase